MSMGTLAQVAIDTGGELHGADHDYAAVSTDTRTLGPGDLFFALRGENFDANNFVADAFARGAAGAVVEQKAEVSLAQVQVKDSQSALGAIAREWRQKFALPLIGITGSNGKTTVKELTAAILRAAFPAAEGQGVLATQGNLNNEIGLPLTLLKLRAHHQAAVIEMGASQPGDIATLTAIAQPNIVVISNAARAHLLGFGGIADVAATKGELLDELDQSATAVLNHDDQFYSQWASRAGNVRVLSFGETSAADFYAENIRVISIDGDIGFDFDLHTPSGSVDVSLPLAGQHNIKNALAATAVAMTAGADLEAVKKGLASSRNVSGRLRAITLASGAVIYDDTYNANPDSVLAAIAFVQSLDGEVWLVLGDMGELGADAEALHFNVGEQARKSGVQGLLCVGELSKATASGFGEDAQWFATTDELHAVLSPKLKAGLNVLVKASRFVALDRLVRQLESGA